MKSVHLLGTNSGQLLIAIAGVTTGKKISCCHTSSEPNLSCNVWNTHKSQWPFMNTIRL